MTRKDLISDVSRRMNLPKSTIAPIFDEIVETMSHSLSIGRAITISGFGTLYPVIKKPIKMKSNISGSPTEISLGKRPRVRFRVSAKLLSRMKRTLVSDIEDIDTECIIQKLMR